MDKKHCSGCYNDFYNHRTNFNGKNECCHLENAEIITVFEIHRDTPQDKASRFRKRKRPSCYKAQNFCHYRQLPEHLR